MASKTFPSTTRISLVVLEHPKETLITFKFPFIPSSLSTSSSGSVEECVSGFAVIEDGTVTVKIHKGEEEEVKEVETFCGPSQEAMQIEWMLSVVEGEARLSKVEQNHVIRLKASPKRVGDQNSISAERSAITGKRKKRGVSLC